ncbi:hypothetical protein KDU71_02430 [Carboxylicivirga sediminis]|uniref:Uncharacterized protein n=2 Tax=Carboxylicivirga sediminis TaxID=2006564 RepID=A0A941EZU2_9BACT|nr:hypothetical protein [Carboxylicivirga sediminis]
MAPKGQPGRTLTFYSFPAEEAKGQQAVMGGLYQRILQKSLGMNFFYAILKHNDGSDKELRTIKGNRFIEVNGRKDSSVRLVVYNASNNREVFYPDNYEHGKNHQFIIGSMQQRILNGQLNGQYKNAMFINTENDKEIARVRGNA